jgi:hypothetical protein
VKREMSWTLDVVLAGVRVLTSTHFLKASFSGLVILLDELMDYILKSRLLL